MIRWRRRQRRRVSPSLRCRASARASTRAWRPSEAGRLDHVELPYVYSDAAYLNARDSVCRPASTATAAATAVTSERNREILSCDVGDSESETFSQPLMESLRDRGLHGARLVITDTYRGLAATADRWFQRTARQRRRMHFIPNLPAALPRSHQHMAAALFRTILAQPDTDSVTDAWDQDGTQPAASFPKTGPLIDTARAEVLAFAAFPKAHWQKI